MRKTKNNYVPAEYGGYLFPKSCLPDILPGDAGKVLTVNQNETEAIWAQSDGGLIVYVDDPVFNSGGDMMITGGTLDHTWSQINTALRGGIPVQIVAVRPVVADELSDLIVIHIQAVYSHVFELGYIYIIDAFSGDISYSFASRSADGYPEYAEI